MRTLFRARAVSARGTEDASDERVRVARVSAWVSLAFAVLLVLGFAIWLAAGTVAITLAGSGVINNAPANAVVHAPTGGVVISALPPVGTTVRAGDTIGLVEDNTLQPRSVVPVLAPVHGKVVSQGAGPNATVEFGDYLGAIAPDSGAQVGYLFVAAQKADQLRAGMQVLLAPASADATHDGMLVGNVDAVSPLPAEESRVAYLTGNSAYARQLLSNGPVVEVRVRLQSDRSTPSGYVWTQPPGPRNAPTSGVPTDATFVLERVPPYQAFFGGP